MSRFHCPEAQFGEIAKARLDIPLIGEQVTKHIKVVASRHRQVKERIYEVVAFRCFGNLFPKRTHSLQSAKGRTSSPTIPPHS